MCEHILKKNTVQILTGKLSKFARQSLQIPNVHGDILPGKRKRISLTKDEISKIKLRMLKEFKKNQIIVRPLIG